jgi:hypothetical protein
MSLSQWPRRGRRFRRAGRALGAPAPEGRERASGTARRSAVVQRRGTRGILKKKCKVGGEKWWASRKRVGQPAVRFPHISVSHPARASSLGAHPPPPLAGRTFPFPYYPHSRPWRPRRHRARGTRPPRRLGRARQRRRPRPRRARGAPSSARATAPPPPQPRARPAFLRPTSSACAGAGSSLDAARRRGRKEKGDRTVLPHQCTSLLHQLCPRRKANAMAGLAAEVAAAKAVVNGELRTPEIRGTRVLARGKGGGRNSSSSRAPARASPSHPPPFHPSPSPIPLHAQAAASPLPPPRPAPRPAP